ncbi:MAG TPA: hypothetical protein VFQ39_14350 [Longimicrobium sp.]|nr:hypothetical protein [Longimicrobium sp.]
MAQPKTLTDAERAKLEQRRDRLMQLMKDDSLEADDRDDLRREWQKIDDLLQHR